MRRLLMLVAPLLLLSGLLSGCVVSPWHDADERGGYQERRHDRYREAEHHHHDHDQANGYHDDDRYRDQGGGYRSDGRYPEEHR